jgi:kinesin family member 4
MSTAPASDCVKVAIRVRPFVPSEISRGCIQVIDKSPGLPQLAVTGESHSKTQDYYAFNNVFMPEETQEEVYVNSVQPIIGKLFEGYNVTILAYG